MIWSPNTNTWHLFGVINGIFIQRTICRRTASIFDWNLEAHTVPVGKHLGLGERGARWATFSLNTNIFKIDGLTQLKFCLGIVCEVFSKVSKSACTHHAYDQNHFQFITSCPVAHVAPMLYENTLHVHVKVRGHSAIALWPRTLYAQRWSILNLFEFLKFWGKTACIPNLILSWAANSDTLNYRILSFRFILNLVCSKWAPLITLIIHER